MVTRSGASATIRLESDARLIVFGDIHGDLETLNAGLALRKPGDVTLFLGDYADRGPNGVEVIERVNELLDSEFDTTVAIKGNHEAYDDRGDPTFRPCTLVDEAIAKRGSWRGFFESFSKFVTKLQLAAVVPESLLFVHGGIHASMTDSAILESPTTTLESELLWSDPAESSGPSRRGVGHRFDASVTKTVCSAFGVESVVRSHEPAKALSGPRVEHGGLIVTTSSTTTYGGRAYVLVVDPSSIRSGYSLVDSAVYL